MRVTGQVIRAAEVATVGTGYRDRPTERRIELGAQRITNITGQARVELARQGAAQHLAAILWIVLAFINLCGWIGYFLSLR